MNFDDFVSELNEYKPDKILFVGLGNEYRGDDGAGLIFLEEIQKRKEFSKSNFIQAGRNPENYLHRITSIKPKVIIFIDAANFSKEPGTISFLSPEQIDVQGISTHAFSIKLIEKYLINEQQIEFRYLGIQPKSTKFHEEISIVVSEKIKEFFM